jgi:hypothetical protein
MPVFDRTALDREYDERFELDQALLKMRSQKPGISADLWKHLPWLAPLSVFLGWCAWRGALWVVHVVGRML